MERHSPGNLSLIRTSHCRGFGNDRLAKWKEPFARDLRTGVTYYYVSAMRRHGSQQRSISGHLSVKFAGPSPDSPTTIEDIWLAKTPLVQGGVPSHTPQQRLAEEGMDSEDLDKSCHLQAQLLYDQNFMYSHVKIMKQSDNRHSRHMAPIWL